MIYKLIRPIVRFATKLYFRKIYISGLENIPDDKPVILVCNHPSAFIEPCLLACYLPLNLHFLVRGDLFSKGWLSWLLKGTNQIPIFRYKDGLENVRKNLITQESVIKLFQENKSLLMFPEAHTHENIFLRPLKKGLARFSLLDHGADVHILPVGVNFDKNIDFASKVSLIIGKAISISEFKKEEFPTEAKMNVELLDRVFDSMKKCLRHIDNEEREDVIHESYRVRDIVRDEKTLPVVSNSNQVFLEEQYFANKIDSNVGFYEKTIDLLGGSRILSIKKPNPMDLLFMITMLPLFFFSLVIHGLPVLIVKMFVKKRISVHEFKAPVFLVLMIFLYLFITITGLILSVFLGLDFFIFLIIAIVVGIIGVSYYKAYHMKWNYLFASQESREDVISRLNQMQFSN